MNTKNLGVLALLAVLVIGVVLISGCVGSEAKTGPGGITVPSGFTKVGYSPDIEGGVSAAYLGSGTVGCALSVFKSAAINAGWTFIGKDVVAAGITGAGFEKGGEILIIQVIQAGDQIAVTVIIGPKDIEDAPVEEVTPEEVGPPTSDAPGGEDISDVPRYPGSIRTAYIKQGVEGDSMTMIYYVAPASVEEVREFYKEELLNQGWKNIELMQVGESYTVMADKIDADTGGSDVSVGCMESGHYKGYTEITVMYGETTW